MSKKVKKSNSIPEFATVAILQSRRRSSLNRLAPDLNRGGRVRILVKFENFEKLDGASQVVRIERPPHNLFQLFSAVGYEEMSKNQAGWGDNDTWYSERPASKFLSPRPAQFFDIFWKNRHFIQCITWILWFCPQKMWLPHLQTCLCTFV